MSNVLGDRGGGERGLRVEKCSNTTFLVPLKVSALIFGMERGQAKAILQCCCASMSNDKQQLVKI